MKTNTALVTLPERAARHRGNSAKRLAVFAAASLMTLSCGEPLQPDAEAPAQAERSGEDARYKYYELFISTPRGPRTTDTYFLARQGPKADDKIGLKKGEEWKFSRLAEKSFGEWEVHTKNEGFCTTYELRNLRDRSLTSWLRLFSDGIAEFSGMTLARDPITEAEDERIYEGRFRLDDGTVLFSQIITAVKKEGQYRLRAGEANGVYTIPMVLEGWATETLLYTPAKKYWKVYNTKAHQEFLFMAFDDGDFALRGASMVFELADY